MADLPLVVVMGASGSGKSTVGPRLAAALGVEFLEGDDVHTPAARAQMARGEPLDDAARAPWLDRLHADLAAHAERGVVLACSALKPAYRRRLVGELRGVVFLALVEPRAVLEARLATRRGHFAGPDLVASQLADLELDEDTITIDGTRPVDAVVAAAREAVRGRQP